ncbi:MAG: TolC family protein, partial [Desulfobacteraceae bacterium]|nr:TolC family protein [Desulfobacteraceae bacterium]
WPSRFWAVGPTLTESIFEGGLRRALTEEARAAYDANVAFYRQTVLAAFGEVEDNLATLRILEKESRVQEAAVKASQKAVTVISNQYKAGIVSYLNVINSQTAELVNEKAAAQIMGNRLTAAVLLIKALGGGWDVSALGMNPAMTPVTDGK